MWFTNCYHFLKIDHFFSLWEPGKVIKVLNHHIRLLLFRDAYSVWNYSIKACIPTIISLKRRYKSLNGIPPTNTSIRCWPDCKLYLNFRLFASLRIIRQGPRCIVFAVSRVSKTVIEISSSAFKINLSKHSISNLILFALNGKYSFSLKCFCFQ